MDNKEQLSHRWAILNHNGAWIQSADTKATALLGISGLIISFLLSSLFSLATTSADFSVIVAFGWTTTFLAFGIVSLLISLFCTLLCLISRTGLKNALTPHIEAKVFRPEKTLVFFGTVSRYSPGKYKEMLASTEITDVLDDLALQIHVLSRIATEKYLWLQRAYVYLALSMFFLSVFGVFFIL